MTGTPAVSVILPLSWVPSGLPELYEALRRVLPPAVGTYELLLLADPTDPAIRPALHGLHERCPEARVLFTSRRMGGSVALAAAIQASRAPRLLILDTSLQVAVEDVPRLLEPLEKGMDLVCTWRSSPAHGLSRIPSGLFNLMARFLSQVPMHDLASRTFAVRRAVVQEIPMYGDLHRFLPLFLARDGVPWCEVKVRPQRAQPIPLRPSAYARRFFDLLTLAFLTRFSRRPLHFFGLLGLASFSAGFALCAWLTYEKFAFQAALSQRPLLLLGVLLIVVGIQIASIGLLGELMIFTQARRAEDYYVRDTLE